MPIFVSNIGRALSIECWVVFNFKMDYNEFMKKIAWSDIQYWILAFIIGAILLSIEGFGMPTTQMPVISMFVLVILIIHLSINLIIYLFARICLIALVMHFQSKFPQLPTNTK